MQITGNEIIESAASFLGLDISDSRFTDPINLNQNYILSTVNAVLAELGEVNRRICGSVIAPSRLDALTNEVKCCDMVGQALAPMKTAMYISMWYDRDLYGYIQSAYKEALEMSLKSIPSQAIPIKEVY